MEHSLRVIGESVLKGHSQRSGHPGELVQHPGAASLTSHCLRRPAGQGTTEGPGESGCGCRRGPLGRS